MSRLSAKPASIASVDGADNIKMQGQATRAFERDNSATWRRPYDISYSALNKKQSM